MAVSGAGAAVTGCGILPYGRTQQARTVHVGVLAVPSRADSEKDFEGFVTRAQELGWRVGDNLLIEERWGNGRRDQVVQFAADLVRLPVDVVVAVGTAPVQAAKQASSTIPIVMTGVASDPVASGLITSLARPGGNLTGTVTNSAGLSRKRLELLAEVVPGLSRLAVLATADNASRAQAIGDLQAAADVLGVELRAMDVATDDLPRAFEAARAWPAQALLFIGDPALRDEKVLPRIVALVDQLHLPAMYSDRPSVEAGGLMYYMTDSVAQWRRAANFADRILRGARPADLPVELPTTFQFGVNATTVQTLGLNLPPQVAVQVTDWMQ
jgi:putative ABC transport system substrate-binding protein